MSSRVELDGVLELDGHGVAEIFEICMVWYGVAVGVVIIWSLNPCSQRENQNRVA